MAWTTPTSETLQLRMAADWASLTSASRNNAVTMANVVAGVISDVVGTIRGYIQGNPDNTMGAEGSLPPETMGIFYTLARLALIATVPGGQALADEVRLKQEMNAYDQLKMIAKGTIRVSPADDAAADAPAAAAAVYTGDSPLDWDNDTVTNT